jgi:hypothetical protein
MSDPYSRNPYAPSRASLAPGATAADVTSDVSVWRDGRTVVALADASLPPRCVKCNEPADQPTKERTVYWAHPALYLLLLIVGPLIMGIIYVIVRKKADVNPGLCETHKKRRIGAQLYGWLGFFGGFLLACIGGAADSGAPVLIGLFLMVSAIVVGMAWGRLIHAKKITPDEVRLGGCSAAFLDSLPDYPARR